VCAAARATRHVAAEAGIRRLHDIGTEAPVPMSNPRHVSRGVTPEARVG
jgi:hypothetical protein